MAVPYPRAVRAFPTVRQSLLAKFADCGLSTGFDLMLAIAPPHTTRRLHVSGWTTHRASAGRLIHATIARTINHMLAQKPPLEGIDEDTILEFYDEQLAQRDAPLHETFAMPAHEDAQARRTLRKWARDNRITVEDVAGVEKRLEVVVTYPDGEGGVVERIISGQLDLLLISPPDARGHQHATVPDWKDTWKLPSERRADPDDDDWDAEDDKLSEEGFFQQRVYALLVFLTYPSVQSVTLREFYLRRSVPREATLWRDRDLDNLVRYFGATVERFDRAADAALEPAKGRRKRAKPLATTAQWGEPSPGSHCYYCPLPQECPLDRRARVGGAVTTDAEAEEAAGQILVARAAAKTLGKSLSTRLDKGGPVRVKDAKRDRLFGFVSTVRTERPSRAEVDKAMLAGRDPRDLYRDRVHTRLTDFTPDADVVAEMDDDDVVALFEAAAAKRQSKRKARA